MALASQQSPIDPLLPLLIELATSRGGTPSAEAIASAGRIQGPWMRRVELAAPVIGLQVRWLRCGSEVLLEHARPDLPLVTWLEDEGGGRWLLVDDARFGRVRVREVGSSDRARWVAPARAFGKEDRSWARMVPSLPATPLGAGESSTRSARRRLASLLHAERQDIGVIVIYAIAVGVLSLATPVAIQLLINWLAFGAVLQPILTLGAALFFCLTFAAALRSAQRHAVEIVQRRIFARTVTDLSTRLTRVRIERYDTAYGPELANRFFDVLTLQKAANALLLDGLAYALQAAVGLLVLALYHPFLLVFDLVVVGLVLVVLLPLARGAETTAMVESKKKYAMAAWLEEIARHPLSFKLGGAHLAESRTDRLTEGYLDARESHFSVFFLQYVGMQGVGVLVPTTLLVVAGWLVLDGQLTLGQLVAAEFIIASALAGLTKFTDKLETVYDLLAGVDKLGALFDLPLDAAHGGTRESREGPASAALSDVIFSFPNGARIGPLNLDMPAGRSISIFAAPGSGKSTLAELVLGLRQPAAGNVLRDGIPVSSLRPAEVFEESALVRPSGLFTGTVRDNLTIGRPFADDRLWEVLSAVGLAATLRNMPSALETPLLPHGAPLSSEDVRALLLARALLTKPRILVVDGLLDGVAEPVRERWLSLLLDSQALWTTLILTADPAVAHQCGTRLELKEGRLHARAILTTI